MQQMTKDDSAIVPVKAENERVIRENNALHKEIIEVKERYEEDNQKWKKRTRLVEDERDDYAAVVAQKDYKIKEMELINLQLKEKLDQVMSKSLWPSTTEILKTMPRQHTEGE